MTQEYYIDCDYDGHNYIIPIEKKAEFEQALVQTYEHDNDVPLPEGIIQIDNFSNIVFTTWRKK